MRRVLAILLASLSLTVLPLGHAAEVLVLVGGLAYQEEDCPAPHRADVTIAVQDLEEFATLETALHWYEAPCIGDFGTPLDRTAGGGILLGEDAPTGGWTSETVHPGLGIFSRDWLNITPNADGTYHVSLESSANGSVPAHGTFSVLAGVS